MIFLQIQIMAIIIHDFQRVVLNFQNANSTYIIVSIPLFKQIFKFLTKDIPTK